MLDITYRTLSDAALVQWKAKAQNIRNFAGIPAQFKANYVYDQVNARARLRYVINNSTAVYKHTDADLENNWYTFLNLRGIGLDEKVTADGMFNFFSAMTAWAATRLVLCSSQLNSTRVCCFKNASGTGTTVALPGIIKEGEIARASDVNALITIITKINNCPEKNYPIRYALSMWATG